MPNMENLNLLIETIRKQPAELCIMSLYGYQHNCGTAHCIGGWIETLMRNPVARGKDRAEWLGVSYGELANLEHMYGAKNVSTDTFDHRYSPEQRKDIMLHVLATLADTGRIDWEDALIAKGGR